MLVAEEQKLQERTPRLSSGKVAVIIPTLNAASCWAQLRRSLEQQSLDPSQILIVDSSSTDNTAALAHEAGFFFTQIAQSDFNHGGTRSAACRLVPKAEFLVFLTQDATPDSARSILDLCRAFEDPEVGAVYGRQLPRPGATPIEQHARRFNYPTNSHARSLRDRDTLGLKAAFLSNSFAAYRRSALDQVGGFPDDVILAEDSVVAARMLLAGWRVAYTAEAAVIHSHNMPLRKEFARYFDTGVHHARQGWLLRQFGSAGGEGKRFVFSELSFLWQHAKCDIPEAMLRTLLKWTAYQFGRRERYLSPGLKLRLSSCPSFWSTQASVHDLE